MVYTMFAAIDVGSNDISMKIYELSKKNGIKEIDFVSHIMCLGSETYRNGKVSFILVEELCDILLKFKRKMEEYEVKEYRAYATSAIREARNSQMIIDQIKLKTGLEVNILSNSEQRFLTYKAIASRTNDFNKIIQKNTAIIDMGAGSIQISLFDKQVLSVTQNIKIGALRIKEVLGNLENKITNFDVILEEYIGNEIDTFKNLFLKDKEIKNVIAVGDEILSGIKLIKELNIKDSINKEDFMKMYDKLKRNTPEQISVKYGISYEVATVLLPSAMVYRRFLEESKAEMIWTPKVTFCDAIVADYADTKKMIQLEHDFKEDIIVTASNMAKRYKCNKIHIQNVTQIALDVFDNIKKMYGLNEREKLLLQIAVILHDCGKYINMNAVALNSYDIIMSTEIIGLSHKEREIIANIVKYNTVELPSYDAILNKEDTKTYLQIARLSAILRIANAMDRSHKQKIKKCKVSVEDNQLILTADALMDITLERGLFESKADFFEEVYGIRPVLKQKRSV